MTPVQRLSFFPPGATYFPFSEREFLLDPEFARLATRNGKAAKWNFEVPNSTERERENFLRESGGQSFGSWDV